MSKFKILTGRNISEFKKDQTIVRVAPSSIGDNSFRGQPMRYIGIANNMIYVKAKYPSFFADHMIDLKIEQYENGWESYVDPNTIEREKTVWEKFVNELKDYYQNFKQFCKEV